MSFRLSSLFLNRWLGIAPVSLALSACSALDGASNSIISSITPYKIEIVQGNVVTKEQKEALQNGMPRQQVRDILGAPLIADAFHAERWDYVFSIRRVGQAFQQRKLSVTFKGDELAKVESDELPSEEEFVGSLSAKRALGKVPRLQATPEELARASSAAPIKTAPVVEPVAPRSYPPLESATR